MYVGHIQHVLLGSHCTLSYFTLFFLLQVKAIVLLPHPYTLARICCNSMAECKDYTLGPN